ncbi:MAG TPA: dihydropteroate synthase, partial [Devosiaceae bacterium]|nr:dihydropteroate synthase [Devosiaceae bacterium]
LTPEEALGAAIAMVAEGAGLIDVGGESTRPGADPVDARTELARLMPVLAALAEAKLGVPVSIDTSKAVVAHQAVESGAEIINDVRGFQTEPEIAAVAAGMGAAAVAMHWDPDRDRGKDLIGEVIRYFEKTVRIAGDAGLPRDRLILDPGFGFAKDFKENYEILRRLDELAGLGYPLLVGLSRKSMLGKLLGVEPRDRLAGTVATSALAYLKGAHVFRVHDIAQNLDGLKVVAATLYGPPAPLET